MAPAIYLDGTLDKISAYSPWSSQEYEKPRVLGGTATHARSTAYLLRDVRINGAWIYSEAFKAQHGFGPDKLFQRHPREFTKLDHVHLVSNSPGSNFFGNFLLDEFPLELLPKAGDNRIGLQTKAYEHEAGYREILGLPRPLRVGRARCHEVIVYRDFAQNSLKQGRYQTLRQRLRHSINETASESFKRVYLKRGVTGEARIVANEHDLEEHLTNLGFDIVEPAVLSTQDVCRRMIDAKLVISVEGSHLAHAIYTMADDAALLVLEPPDRFAMPYKDFTDRMNMRFAFLVGDHAQNGFNVDLTDLDRLIDLLT
ncbi:glycosyltransferase 61 family protein [Ruegeria sp. ANG-S4]|uniref:glycosyltransferase 61 family protein n=1 Tax=Ruegeria sp. ANG-S4 TaxID=1577904 RepID=UPI00187CF754|nr:glycosyltransferase family 61 protein [Ruegeria sp. ANG-S4]